MQQNKNTNVLILIISQLFDAENRESAFAAEDNCDGAKVGSLDEATISNTLDTSVTLLGVKCSFSAVVGVWVGIDVGSAVGLFVGMAVGLIVGSTEGNCVGTAVTANVGASLGLNVGDAVDGLSVGSAVVSSTNVISLQIPVP